MNASTTPVHRVGQGLLLLSISFRLVFVVILAGVLFGTLSTSAEYASSFVTHILFNLFVILLLAVFLVATLLNSIGRVRYLLWTPATIPERSNAVTTPLHRIAEGLLLLSISLRLILAAPLVGVLFFAFARSAEYAASAITLILFYLFGILLLAAFFVAPLLNSIGRVQCLLWTPATIPGRGVVSACLAMDIIAFLLALGCFIVLLPSSIEKHGYWYGPAFAGLAGWMTGSAVALAVSWLSFALFLLYLRRLAQYLGERRLAARAITIFCMFLAELMFGVLAGIWFTFSSHSVRESLSPLLPLAVLLLAVMLVVFVLHFLLYGRLVICLYRVTKQYASGGLVSGEPRAESVVGNAGNVPLPTELSPS